MSGRSAKHLAKKADLMPVSRWADIAQTGVHVLMGMLYGFYILFLYSGQISARITGGDSGELASTLCTASIPHPPGYPTFSLLYEFLTLIFVSLHPGLTPAFYYSFSSAIIGTWATLLLARCAYNLTASMSAAIFASLTFASSSTVFSYSTQVEVFALNNLLVAAVLWASITRRPRIAAFISGLAMSNQHTSLLTILPLTSLAVLRSKRLPTSSYHLTLAILFMCGLAPPYLVLYMRSGRYRSWGQTDHLAGILTHIFRREYGTLQLASENIDTGSAILDRVYLYLNDLVDQISIPGLCLVIVGFTQYRRCHAVKDLALAWVFYVITFSLLNNMSTIEPLFLGVQQRFYQQPLLMVSLILALGYSAIEQYTSHIYSRSVAIVLLAVLSGRSAPNHEASIVQRYAEEALGSISPESLVLVSGDVLVHPFLYLQSCEGYRPDLDIIAIPNLATTWFVPQQARFYRNVTFPGSYLHSSPPGFTALNLVEANIGRRRIFSCGGGLLAAGENPKLLRNRFLVRPLGACSEIIPRSSKTNWEQLQRAFRGLIQFQDQNFASTSWDRAVIDHVELRKTALIHAMYDFFFENHDRSEDVHRIHVAVQLLESMDLSSKGNHFYRRAADLYGWMSRIETHPYQEKMFHMLEKIVTMENDAEILSILKRRDNPYLFSSRTNRI